VGAQASRLHIIQKAFFLELENFLPPVAFRRRLFFVPERLLLTKINNPVNYLTTTYQHLPW